jgi:3-hydroxyisobutyrate dehydrogenase-like beta-hydroxyacid dehydrogenase
MKLLNNLKIMAEVALIAEVVALGVRGGIPAGVINEVLAQSSADSFMWRYQVPRMVAGDFTPGFSVDHGHKDLSLAEAWAGRLGMPLPIGDAARAVFAAAQQQGRGALDTAALVARCNS